MDWATILKWVVGITVGTIGFIFVDFQQNVRSDFDKVAVTVAHIYNEVRDISEKNAVLMEIVRRHDIDIEKLKQE